MSREFTGEEVREQVLQHVAHLIRYWEREGTNTRDALEGFAYSFLSMLDGCSDLPGFYVVPFPHPEDSPFYIGEGENYYPESKCVEDFVAHDIGGGLHEQYTKYL